MYGLCGELTLCTQSSDCSLQQNSLCFDQPVSPLDLASLHWNCVSATWASPSMEALRRWIRSMTRSGLKGFSFNAYRMYFRSNSSMLKPVWTQTRVIIYRTKMKNLMKRKGIKWLTSVVVFTDSEIINMRKEAEKKSFCKYVAHWNIFFAWVAKLELYNVTIYTPCT